VKAPRGALRVVAASVLLFGVAAGLHSWFTPRLPHKKLRQGGELRVLQVHYDAVGGQYGSHQYQRAPEWKFRVWNALPQRLQNIISPPSEGIGGYSSDHPAISIWWAHIDAGTHKAEIGKAGWVTVTLDNGGTLPRIWPEPAEDYREILIINPPHDSRQLRVKFHICDEAVHFTIDNPAYHNP